MMTTNAKIVLVLAALVLVLGSAYWLTHRGAPTDGRNILDSIYSQSLDQMLEITDHGLHRLAPTWMPASAQYLRTNYGSTRDVTLTSTKMIETHGPLGELKESVWQVTAEHGNYEMVTDLETSKGKLAIIAFRFPPSNRLSYVVLWH